MGSDSFQWCPATGQGATGTNWSTGNSVWTWGRASGLWGWGSTGAGCAERSWILLFWRYSRPAWTRSSTACCRRPCFGRGAGLDDPFQPLPFCVILWLSTQHHTPHHSHTTHPPPSKKKKTRLLTLANALFVYHRLWFSRTQWDSSKNIFKMTVTSKGATCIGMTSILCNSECFVLLI